jgi:LysM repeat protein
MIRILALTAMFLMVTVGLLMLQPGPRSDRFVDPDFKTAEDVTRTSSGLLSPQENNKIAIDDVTPISLIKTEPTVTPSAKVAQPVAPKRETPPKRQVSLSDLVLSALNQQKSGEEIDLLIQEAVMRGDIAVPPELMTTEGKVDTRVLLSALVSPASPKRSAPALTGTPYKVKSGDSLASISFSKYGSTASVSQIFDHNRANLASPDQIQVGQTLILPDL